MPFQEYHLKKLGYTNKFKRDLRKVIKRGFDKSKIDVVVLLLRQGKMLSENNREHNLTGNWTDHKECHIAPDWLLVYQIFPDAVILVRTGTHSDLLE
jgi:mRNA interferase YafQ